jgi:hypothetical protein
MEDTLKNLGRNDGFVNKSVFLTNRIGSDVLDKSIVDKAGDFLSMPFKWIDNFTSQVVVRSKFDEGIRKGLSPAKAMEQADNWASKLMGDRSLGSQPTLFNQKSPVTRAFTQFQLEVNNQLSFLLKDLPREYFKDGVNAKNVARLTSALGQTALYGYLFNQFYEKVTGRRPAIDPIGMAVNFNEDTKNKDLTQASLKLGENALNTLPFTSTFTGGRIPIGKPFEELGKGISSTFEVATGKRDAQSGLKQAGINVAKGAAYVLPPFGGSQIIKTSEGLNAVNKGGQFKTNIDGEKYMQFPINKTPSNIAKAAIFGKSSLPETKQFYDKGLKGLSVEQTAAFNKVTSKGLEPDKTYKLIQDLRKLKPLPTKKTVSREQKLQLINSSKLSDSQKALFKKEFIKK